MTLLKSVKFIDELGSSYGIKQIGNKPRTVTNPYGWEMSFGNVPNHFPRNILGYNPLTPALSVLADLSELGVNMIPIPQVATAMEVISTSAQDGVAGTGVLTVKIKGLTAGFVLDEEIITMNGLTAVPTTKNWLRINSFTGVTNGAFGNTAAGDITLQTVGGATIYKKISLGSNTDRTGHFTVPAGFKGLIVGGGTSTTGKETDVILRATVDEDRNLLPGVYQFLGNVVSKDGGELLDLKLPYFVPEKCDIKVSARDINGGGGGTASANIQIFCEPV